MVLRSNYRPALLVVLAVALAWATWWWMRPDDADPPEPLGFPVGTGQSVTPLPAALPLDARKIELGWRLFHDTRLSRDASVACATCHDLSRAGIDGRPLAVGIDGRVGERNSPTVFNTAFNFRQFWDGRAATLEQQAAGPVHNPLEMDSNWAQVLGRLGRDARYQRDFRAIWPDGVTADNIQQALAEFQRSLITPDAPFDRFLRGDASALDPLAQRGWQRFRELGCIACHQGINLGGNMYAHLGVMGDFFADRGRPVVKGDLGRYNVTGREQDRHVFKVPGLRNVAVTGPYFHDGSVATLEEAVVIMARYQLGVTLSGEDKAALVAFLKSLTGTRPPLSAATP
jgi:cytochrome c peroxidase